MSNTIPSTETHNPGFSYVKDATYFNPKTAHRDLNCHSRAHLHLQQLPSKVSSALNKTQTGTLARGGGDEVWHISVGLTAQRGAAGQEQGGPELMWGEPLGWPCSHCDTDLHPHRAPSCAAPSWQGRPRPSSLRRVTCHSYLSQPCP